MAQIRSPYGDMQTMTSDLKQRYEDELAKQELGNVNDSLFNRTSNKIGQYFPNAKSAPPPPRAQQNEIPEDSLFDRVSKKIGEYYPEARGAQKKKKQSGGGGLRRTTKPTPMEKITEALDPNRPFVGPTKEMLEGPYDPKKEAEAQAVTNQANVNLPVINVAENDRPQTRDDIMDLLDAAYRRPMNVGIKPLAALVDAQTGSKFSNAYANEKGPGENFQEYADKRLQYKHLQSEELKALMTAMGKAKGEAELKPRDKLTNMRLGGTELAKAADKAVTEFSGQSDSYRKLFSALESGGVQDVQASLSLLARAVGAEKGALSEGDVRRNMIRTLGGDWAQFKSYLGTDAMQEMPANLRQTLLKIAKRGAQGAVINADSHVKRLKDSFKNRPEFTDLGFDVDARMKPFEESLAQLKGNLGQSSAEKAIKDATRREAGPPKGMKPAHEMTDAELKEYIKKNNLKY